MRLTYKRQIVWCLDDIGFAQCFIKVYRKKTVVKKYKISVISNKNSTGEELTTEINNSDSDNEVINSSAPPAPESNVNGGENSVVCCDGLMIERIESINDNSSYVFLTRNPKATY